jgi:hypothetical protein
MFKKMVEEPEVEAARLAEAPIGSTLHELSKLPVNIHEYLMDLLIEVPLLGHPSHKVIVVPIDSHRYVDVAREPLVFPMRRYDGAWTCAVVSSNHKSYPVGGHRISIPEAQLVRGKLHTL